MEIAFRGMDNDGNQTLDVFRKTSSPIGFGLYYESICSIAVDGTVEIESVERSEAYKDGQTNGESNSIVTLQSDPHSENLLDLIRTRFYWRFSERRYIEDHVDRIPGEVVAQTQLRELFRSGTSAFEKYLTGIWYLESGEVVEEGFLFFEPETKRFTYYFGNTQEIYLWDGTYKILVNQVEIVGTNELVPYIRKNVYVRVEALDGIRLLGSDPWRGSYRRVAGRGLNDLRAAGSPTTTVGSDIELSGSYVSDLGERFVFTGNEFTLEEAGQTISGLFSLYRIDISILELKVREKTGVVTETRRYRLTFEEETKDDRVYRTLYLVPGVVGIYGFEPIGDGYVRYEQIHQS